MTKNIAVILAGGSGERLGAAIPKQFLKIAGKMVIEHTLDVFERNAQIDEIAVVIHPNFLHEMEAISARNHFTKLKKILAGGKTRSDSSLAAIRAYDGDNVNLIFHDAVRPLVNDRIINEVISALENYAAVDVAIASTDTIITVDEDNLICNIPSRAKLRNGQTPQAFRLETIKQAYALATQDTNFIATDDCGVVKKYLPEVNIFVVKGEPFNIKLTHKEDLFLLDKLFQLKSKQIFPIASSSEQLKEKVLVIIGGTEGIGAAIKQIASRLGARVYATSRREGVDVCNSQALRDYFAEIQNKAGKIDYVVNTAGILDKQALTNMDYATITRSININLLGSINCAKEVYPYLCQTHGMLLLFTSSSYTRGRSLYSVYSATKAAIVNLTQALSEEWLGEVQVNCMNPSRTNTPMRTRNFGNEPKETLLTPESVAQSVIATLLSQETGQVIDVKKSRDC